MRLPLPGLGSGPLFQHAAVDEALRDSATVFLLACRPLSRGAPIRVHQRDVRQFVNGKRAPIGIAACPGIRGTHGAGMDYTRKKYGTGRSNRSGSTSPAW
jgi:hypothetical protein